MSTPTILDGIRNRVPLSAKRWWRTNSIAVAFVIAVWLLWEIYWNFLLPEEQGNLFFPSTGFVIEQTLENRVRVFDAIIQTGSEVIIGFCLALSLAIFLAVMMAEFQGIREASLPLLVLNYSAPHAIFAPLFVVWFGSSVWAIGLFVMWAGFYPAFVNCLTGLTQLEEEYYHLGEVTGASRWQFLRYIKFPAAMPHIAGGVKLAVQQAVVGAIVAEFIASGRGLGFFIKVAAALQQTGLLFGTILITVFGTFIFFTIVDWVMDYLTPGPMDV